MIESVLVRNHVRRGVGITVKALISAGIIALAVILPQLVHLAAGAQGGVEWLPMYLPVLLGGCLLGWKWGLGVGILSPVVSFALTSIGGNAMPAAARLPIWRRSLRCLPPSPACSPERLRKTAGWRSPQCSLHRSRAV